MSTLDREAVAAVPIKPAKQARTSAFAWGRAALRVLATLAAVAIAAALGWYAWRAYMGTPWTRDGTVRAYVVTIAPQVAGQIIELPARDNQFVHKGDLLMQIDPASWTIAVQQAEANVAQAKALAQNAEAEWARRQKLNDLAVTLEEQQTYASKSLAANAQYQLALVDLQNARLNLKRTRIVAPVNGYVTNLLAQVGDYANVGQRQVSVIDADSFWVDAYFEETFLAGIHDGDAAKVKLMGYPDVLRGHVQSVARGISVPNATPSALGLAEVNPIFAFVRLAQRVPVRIHLTDVPSQVRLVAGLTATVEIEPGAPRTAAAEPPATSTSAAKAPAAVANVDKPPPASAPTPVIAPDAGAVAILPALKMGSSPAGSGEPAKAPPPAAAGAEPSPAGTTPPDVAKAEAKEVLSDEAFDRTLDLLAPTSQSPTQRHAPDTIRHRGWRHRER